MKQCEDFFDPTFEEFYTFTDILVDEWGYQLYKIQQDIEKTQTFFPKKQINLQNILGLLKGGQPVCSKDK